MAKLTLSDITTVVNAPTSINANSALIEAALENTLSRDGTSPNAMNASLDMNSNRILNLPEPTLATEPVRLGDLLSSTSVFTQDGTGAVARTVNAKLLEQPFSVKDFGAVGDNSTNDTAAIQAAINAASLVNGTVFFPIGIYRTGPLTIGTAGSYGSCNIVGETLGASYASYNYAGAVLVLENSSNDNLFTIAASNSGDVGPAPVLFQDIWMRGNRSNQSGTSYGVRFTPHTATSNKQRSGFFKRVRIGEFRSGGVYVGTLRNAGVAEQLVCLDHGVSGSGSALVLGSCQDWRFWGCDFGSTEGPVVQDSGAQIVNYVGCNFFSAGTHGYKADSAAGDHYFTGCSFDRNMRNGFNLSATTTDAWVFTNCRFTINSQETNNTYSDISITDNPNISFIGCLFSKGGGSITNFPLYHFDLNGVTTKGINVMACDFEATAATSLTSDVTNLNIYGLSSFNSFRVAYDPLDVNQVRVDGGNTGQGPAIYAAGSDTNIPFDVKSKGTSSIRFYTQGGSTLQFVVSNTSSATSYVQTSGSTTDQPSLSAQGSASNIDLLLTPKGTGNVRFGTYTASAATDSTGYILVKDSAGTTRKLMVQA